MKQKRVQFPITLSPETKKVFDDFVSKHPINKSKLVEWVLLEYINKFENNKKI